jgi:hypothetical protein
LMREFAGRVSWTIAAHPFRDHLPTRASAERQYTRAFGSM